MSAVTARFAVLAAMGVGLVACAFQPASASSSEPSASVQSAANAREGDGSTPLYVATTRGWTDVMKELASYGVDINAKDEDGLTALDYSLARARIGFLQQKPPVRNDLARVLRDLGANVENPNLPPWPSVPTPTITAQVLD